LLKGTASTNHLKSACSLLEVVMDPERTAKPEVGKNSPKMTANLEVVNNRTAKLWGKPNQTQNQAREQLPYAALIQVILLLFHHLEVTGKKEKKEVYITKQGTPTLNAKVCIAAFPAEFTQNGEFRQTSSFRALLPDDLGMEFDDCFPIYARLMRSVNESYQRKNWPQNRNWGNPGWRAFGWILDRMRRNEHPAVIWPGEDIASVASDAYTMLVVRNKLDSKVLNEACSVFANISHLHEVQLASQPAAQPDGQPGGQPDGPPAAQPGGPPAAQPDSQPGTQPAGQPGAQPDIPSAAQPGGGSQPDGQPGAQPDGQSGARPGAQPDGQPGAQPGAQLVGQSAGQPGARSLAVLEAFRAKLLRKKIAQMVPPIQSEGGKSERLNSPFSRKREHSESSSNPGSKKPRLTKSADEDLMAHLKEVSRKDGFLPSLHNFLIQIGWPSQDSDRQAQEPFQPNVEPLQPKMEPLQPKRGPLQPKQELAQLGQTYAAQKLKQAEKDHEKLQAEADCLEEQLNLTRKARLLLEDQAKSQAEELAQLKKAHASLQAEANSRAQDLEQLRKTYASQQAEAKSRAQELDNLRHAHALLQAKTDPQETARRLQAYEWLKAQFDAKSRKADLLQGRLRSAATAFGRLSDAMGDESEMYMTQGHLVSHGT
jgi:hypothetical protein